MFTYDCVHGPIWTRYTSHWSEKKKIKHSPLHHRFEKHDKEKLSYTKKTSHHWHLFLEYNYLIACNAYPTWLPESFNTTESATPKTKTKHSSLHLFSTKWSIISIKILMCCLINSSLRSSLVKTFVSCIKGNNTS